MLCGWTIHGLASLFIEVVNKFQAPWYIVGVCFFIPKINENFTLQRKYYKQKSGYDSRKIEKETRSRCEKCKKREAK